MKFFQGRFLFQRDMVGYFREFIINLLSFYACVVFWF